MRARPAVALSLSGALARLTALAGSGAGATAAEKRAGTRPLVIEVLSNRADLVSGGDALLSVDLPAGLAPRR